MLNDCWICRRLISMDPWYSCCAKTRSCNSAGDESAPRQLSTSLSRCSLSEVFRQLSDIIITLYRHGDSCSCSCLTGSEDWRRFRKTENGKHVHSCKLWNCSCQSKSAETLVLASAGSRWFPDDFRSRMPFIYLSVAIHRKLDFGKRT